MTSADSVPTGVGTLPRRIRIGYGLGSVATAAFGTVPGLMLLPYLTDALGVSAAVAGVIVFAPKAWDAILNPIAGRISDRSRHPDGRRAFLVRAGIPLAVCFALMFVAIGIGSVALQAVWVAVWFLACSTAYAFFQVPYVAMPAEITDSYDERTTLMTWRVSVIALTILLTGASAPAIRDAFGGRPGYTVMGIVMAVVIVIGALGAYLGTRGTVVRRHSEDQLGLGAQLRLVGGDRNFRALLVTFVLQAMATGTMLAGVDYLARHVLGRSGASTILFACFVGPAILVTPLWTSYGRRRDKKIGYRTATLALLLGTVVLVGSRYEPAVMVYAATALVGIGYAGMQVFPLAMLPDVAAADTRRSGQHRAGVFTGIWTAGETVGLALGPGLFGLCLAIGGYASSTTGAAVQSTSAVTAIALGFSLLPAILVLGSLMTLRSYRLGRDTVETS